MSKEPASVNKGLGPHLQLPSKAHCTKPMWSLRQVLVPQGSKSMYPVEALSPGFHQQAPLQGSGSRVGPLVTHIWGRGIDLLAITCPNKYCKLFFVWPDTYK